MSWHFFLLSKHECGFAFYFILLTKMTLNLFPWKTMTYRRYDNDFRLVILTHWGRVTHICVSRLTITGSDNGLSPGLCQAIIWTSAGILLIGPNFSENSIEILSFSFTKMRLKVSSAKWRPFCLGLNMLIIFFTMRVPTSFCHWHLLLLIREILHIVSLIDIVSF